MRTRKLLLCALAVGIAVTAAPRATIKPILTESCKPCDDFFTYVNQKFLDSHPIPAEQPRWGQFLLLGDANRERLKVILEDAVARSKAGKLTPGSNDEKIAAYYASCMDTGRIEARGIEPVKPYLDMIAGIQDRAALNKAVMKMFENGLGGPYSLGASPDYAKPDEMIAWILPSGLSLPDRDTYFNTDDRSKRIREQFLLISAKIHRLLGLSESEATAAAKTILEFESRLAEAHMTRVERRDPYKRQNRTDLAGATKTAPSIDWGALLDQVGLSRTVPINLMEPKYFGQLDKEFSEAPLDTWKAYLRGRVLMSVADELPEAFDKTAFEFTQVLTGVKEQEPRWKRCVRAADQVLPHPLGQAFVKKHFPPQAKKRMDALVENLRKTLADELTKADFLGPDTKKQALDKLAKITVKIGYPEKWDDYAPVSMSGASYFENNRAAVSFQRKLDLAKIGKPIDKRTEWGMSPPTVNAYYSPTLNEIAFPAGILQPPFFDMEADDAINYGGIGAVIGHEIGHGFDDQGSKFDAAGKLRNWWTDADKSSFDKRVQCIVDQFNGFDVLPGARHKGKLVTGEALGDVGGLTLAYRAYQRSLNGKKSPVVEDLTGEQRFFISFARIWAYHARQEYTRLQLDTDPHPVPKYRVIETLKNVPEFHKAFRCRQGDAMVRETEKQCRLW